MNNTGKIFWTCFTPLAILVTLKWKLLLTKPKEDMKMNPYYIKFFVSYPLTTMFRHLQLSFNQEFHLFIFASYSNKVMKMSFAYQQKAKKIVIIIKWNTRIPCFLSVVIRNMATITNYLHTYKPSLQVFIGSELIE